MKKILLILLSHLIILTASQGVSSAYLSSNPLNHDFAFSMGQLSHLRDNRGYVHLLWSEREGEKRAPIKYALLRDGKTIFRKTLTSHEVFARNPKIFVDERSTVHAVWQERKGPHRVSLVYGSFHFSESDISGLKLRTVSEGGKARHPDIYADRKGRVFIVWEENRRILLGRLSKGGLLTKRVFLEEGDVHLQKLPSISPGKKGVLIAWSEGEKGICIKRCDEKSLKEYESFRISLNKGAFARRVSLKETNSGMEISCSEGTKGHIYWQGRGKRFFITGAGALIPLHDLNGVEEEGAPERKGISSGRERLLLSSEEGIIERACLLAFFDKGPDLIKCRSGYFESCFPHGPPYSGVFNPAIPLYIYPIPSKFPT